MRIVLHIGQIVFDERHLGPRQVELRRGDWLVLLIAWKGSAWVPERAGRGGRARGAVAWRARRGKGGSERSVRRGKSS